MVLGGIGKSFHPLQDTIIRETTLWEYVSSSSKAFVRVVRGVRCVVSLTFGGAIIFFFFLLFFVYFLFFFCVTHRTHHSHKGAKKL